MRGALGACLAGLFVNTALTIISYFINLLIFKARAFEKAVLVVVVVVGLPVRAPQTRLLSPCRCPPCT